MKYLDICSNVLFGASNSEDILQMGYEVHLLGFYFVSTKYSLHGFYWIKFLTLSFFSYFMLSHFIVDMFTYLSWILACLQIKSCQHCIDKNAYHWMMKKVKILTLGKWRTYNSKKTRSTMKKFKNSVKSIKIKIKMKNSVEKKSF